MSATCSKCGAVDEVRERRLVSAERLNAANRRRLEELERLVAEIAAELAPLEAKGRLFTVVEGGDG
jgi:hypothetical protein